MAWVTVTIAYMCGHEVRAATNQGGLKLSGLQYCAGCGQQAAAVLYSVEAVPEHTRTA